nr:unnamed protein product [Haemonchus contortus]
MPLNLYHLFESVGTIPRICGPYLSQRGLWSDESFNRRLSEVPVLGICLCVILDCVLIALVCFAVHLDEEEENEEEFDEFVSFEDVDEAPTRQEVETQTSPQKLPVVSHVDRGVQTEMPVTEKPSDKILAVKLDQPRQSEC